MQMKTAFTCVHVVHIIHCFRKDPKKVFELFTEIAWPSDGSTEPFILQQYPADYAEEDVLKSVCRFAFPWQHNTEQ